MPAALCSVFYKLIPRSSEQYGEATFLKVAASNMVNLSSWCRSPRTGGSTSSRSVISRVRSRMSRRTPELSRQTTLRWSSGRFESIGRAQGGIANEGVTGDPSRIRTCNPRSRNPLLYPVELWDRRFMAPVTPLGLHSIANMKNPLPGQARFEPFFAARRLTRAVDRCLCPPSTQCCAAAGYRLKPRGSLRQMLHAAHSLIPSAAISPSPFRAFLFETRRLSASQGAPS